MQEQQPHVIPRAYTVNYAAIVKPVVKGKFIDATNMLGNSVVDATLGKMQEYQQFIKLNKKELWLKSSANKFGRLAQGGGNRIKTGANTIFFIAKDKIPEGRKSTYPRFVVDIRPQKEEKHRTRLTVGGNLIEYPSSVTTKTAELETVKFYSTVSFPQSKQNLPPLT
eukprot:2865459-Ditylum_brightwellii.AAC.1